VIVTIEPSGNSFTDTKTVTGAWTQFLNPLGQVFAEVRSNSGNISDFTAEVYPCKPARKPPKALYVRRYFQMSAPGNVDVDVRLYFTEPEMWPKLTGETNITLYQRPSFPGAWSDLGGTAVLPGNYVELTGVTNIAGDWMAAAPWVKGHPKQMAFATTHANYDPHSSSALLQWNTNIQPDANGFIVERAFGQDPQEHDWYPVASTSFSSEGQYDVTDPIEELGRYHYRIIMMDNNGDIFESQVMSLDASSTPEGFSLEQNYPNPFNPETSIQFHLPERTEMSLKVYDLHWREVATLADGTRNGGAHIIRFDASHLPSGTYIYQLKAGAFIQTRKMNLMK
jgi:type IX secretion system substrate protein